MSAEADMSIDSDLNFNKDLSETKETKQVKTAVNEFLKQSKDFEEDRVELAKNNAQTAWKVAVGFAVLAIALAVAISVLTPLKEVKTVLIKVDTTTGYTEVVGAIEDAKEITYGEVLDRYWLKRFVVERNSYEWETIQSSFDTTKLFSGRKVFEAYKKYITGPNSPTEIYEDRRVIRIAIEGVSYLPSNSKLQSIAQVRFVRTIENNSGEESVGYEPTRWIATITYDYLAEIKTQTDRDINPLAFRATSYREDRITD